MLKKKKFALFTGMLATLFTLTNAQASMIDASTATHQGWYTEAGAGTNAYYLGVFSTAGDRSATQSGIIGFGTNIGAGYQFNPNGVAAEGGLLFGRIERQIKFSDNSTATVDANVYAPYFTARWSIPLYGAFSFVPKLGVMFADIPTVDSTYSKTNEKAREKGGGVVLPFVGLGISASVNQSLDVTLQYQGAVYGIIGAGPVTLGLRYYFD
ncbi:MAG: hypothetical protein AABY34_05060 [Pseudomonadota bacterium]